MHGKTVVRIFIFIFIIGALLACGKRETSTDQGDKPFYEGKSIEILVPTSAGGGSDIQARFLSPYISQYVPGNPIVQVVNVPGGGTITGSNEFAQRREANGEYTLWASISTTTAYLLNDPAVQYDYTKMTPIIGYPDGGVVYISPSTGVTEVKDLLNVEEKLIYGGTSATGLPLTTLLSFEVLGLDVDSIFGYESSGPARIAFEQGETNIDFQTTAAYLVNVEPLVEAGSAIPLYTLGQIDHNGDLIRDPAFPELPTVKEVFVELYGEEPSGIEWEVYKTFVGALYTVQKVLFVHEDVPAEAVRDLTESFKAIVEDPTYLTEGGDILNYDPFIGEDLQVLMRNLLDLPDGVQEWVIQYLEEKYDASL